MKPGDTFRIVKTLGAFYDHPPLLKSLCTVTIVTARRVYFEGEDGRLFDLSTETVGEYLRKEED